jgi:DNA end-binding protein Ku
MRQHSYLDALRPRDGAILLETMHYADEVVGVEDLDTLPADAEVSDKELKVAQQLIDALAADFEPDKYRDEYREKLIELIETKAEGGDVAEVAGIEEHEAPRSINLMDALEQSLDRVKKKSA